MLLVPSVRGFAAETDRHLYARFQADAIFHKKRRLQCPPPKRRISWRIRVRAHPSLQKVGQARERHLPVLILHQRVIGLDRLQPYPGAEIKCFPWVSVT